MASGLSRVTSNALTPPASSASATRRIGLRSSRLPIAMTADARLSSGIRGRRPARSDEEGFKFLQEIVDHRSLLAVQQPARRPASVAGDDPASREDRLFRLDNELDVLHPVRNVREQPPMHVECLVVLSGLPRAPKGNV